MRQCVWHYQETVSELTVVSESVYMRLSIDTHRTRNIIKYICDKRKLVVCVSDIDLILLSYYPYGPATILLYWSEYTREKGSCNTVLPCSEILTLDPLLQIYWSISIDLFIEVSEILNLSCKRFAFWVRYCGITVVPGSEILSLLKAALQLSVFHTFVYTRKSLNLFKSYLWNNLTNWIKGYNLVFSVI
jgi:hypothetical protein